MSQTSADPLDHPVLESLAGAHARFAEQVGQVVRYQPEVAPFSAFSRDADDAAWDDLAQMVGPNATATIYGARSLPPTGWVIRRRLEAIQMIGVKLAALRDHEAILLGTSDVPEMLDLIRRTQPGPFLPRTVEMGQYLGIRRGERLIAMAGERLRPPGWTEISAVCTDEHWRASGFATLLIKAIGNGIRERGETPFLHVSAANDGAIRLYRTLGFEVRREVAILTVDTPPSLVEPRPPMRAG
jgi:ribosomal protein S18 acetylase RimI-like enzyme